ncbi:YqaA family protein [Halobacteriaceae archaeon GCM10025711]
MAQVEVLMAVGLEEMVSHATGWPGLGIIFVYSFLIAFILPFPSELVLVPTGSLDIGLGTQGQFTLIVLVSGVGKAAGSLVALRLGNRVTHSGPVERGLNRLGFDVGAWSQSTAVSIAQRWGYLGLAPALAVPFFPDTLSIYAFAVLEDDYLKFAAATFAGGVGRLLITAGIVGGVLVLQ